MSSIPTGCSGSQTIPACLGHSMCRFPWFLQLSRISGSQLLLIFDLYRDLVLGTHLGAWGKGEFVKTSGLVKRSGYCSLKRLAVFFGRLALFQQTVVLVALCFNFHLSHKLAKTSSIFTWNHGTNHSNLCVVPCCQNFSDSSTCTQDYKGFDCLLPLFLAKTTHQTDWNAQHRNTVEFPLKNH